MIYVHDRGRMANNMLQYGHLYAWGREHGIPTLSMRFAYKYKGFRICTLPGENFLRYLYAKLGMKLHLLPVIAWENPNPAKEEIAEREAVMLQSRSCVVTGWNVQYYDLFLKYLDEIKRLFAFESDVESRVETFMRIHGLDDGSYDVLHIRRGDYSRWQGGKYFYSFEEYADIAHRLGGRVVVTTNDPELPRNLFPQETVFSDLGAVEDLCLLSRARRIAGPPSTFSLAATMYGKARLCWIYSAHQELGDDDFKEFSELFRHVI